MSAARRNTMGPGMRFFFGRIFPMIFVLTGGAILYFGVRDILIARDSVNWPSVPGKVISSVVESHRSDDGTTYSAEVHFEYDIEGVTHASNRVGVGSVSTSNPSGARKTVNRYPAGKVVDVFYNPEDPDYGLLETGVRGETWFLPVFGGIFFTVGSVLALFLPRGLGGEKRRRNSGGQNRFDPPPRHDPTDFTNPGGRFDA